MADPILRPLEKTARHVAALIGGVLDEHADANPNSPRVGFTLMMFTFEREDELGWMTYVSNAQREDMIEAMEEFLKKQRQMDGSG